MSFGQAASRADGFPRIEAADPCPYGSGDRFDGCCRPLLRGEPAPTPERLMRSRYTAFLVGDARYLAESWHPRTRSASIDLEPDMRWTKLEIVDAESGETSGTVEFRAHWRQGRERGILHERSRFVPHAGRWWYVDGDVG
ncbi:YchJ family protein [Microbacterium sp. SS28]|uniref:YchJ family protein n=1 Tax=Microbacterium sp. SS28 TaxID=2919948 RepID=UPI001FA965A3|nr:YchJ family metal-binding protein [Microbacterium sp. SS28]